MARQLFSFAEKGTIKKVFQEMLIQKHCQNIQHLTVRHAPFGALKIIPYIVESPLCSSSLLISQIIHYVVRNFIAPQRPAIKDIMNLVYDKNPNWNFSKDQSYIFAYLTRHQTEINSQLNTTRALLTSFPNDLQLQNKQEELTKTLNDLAILLESMVPDKIHLNAFPKSGIENNKMRGLMIQLKGANRGARAERYKQLIGCTEIQSENMRMFECAKQTWLSKVGTFGIKMTAVYGNTSEYANKNLELRDGTQPFRVLPKNWAIE